MNDPFANLKAIDPADLFDISTVEELQMPFDDVPGFTRADDPEVDVNIRLKTDKTFIRTPSRRLFVDYRTNPDAYKHIEYLPALNEDVEMVISGKYAMWELVPALIQKTGRKIDELTITTLSYSKTNAAELLGLLDDGHVGCVNLLISYYFKSTSRPIYDLLVPQLLERGQKVLAMRTHSKIILAKMDDGTCYAIRGSPNLRSSVNVEQLTFTNCPHLYKFHYDWIMDDLINRAELGGITTRSAELEEHGNEAKDKN